MKLSSWSDMDECITEISLAGFRTFAEMTRIPIRRLTFFFGPNSAGKSAVADALFLFRDLYSAGFDPHIDSNVFAWRTNAVARAERLRSHWRRINDDDEKALADNLRIGVKFRHPLYLPNALHSTLHPMERSTLGIDEATQEWISPNNRALIDRLFDSGFVEAEWVTEFTSAVDQDSEWMPECSVRLSINGVDAISVQEGRKLGINLQHLVFSYLGLPKGYKALTRQCPELFEWDGEWLWVRGDYDPQSGVLGAMVGVLSPKAVGGQTGLAANQLRHALVMICTALFENLIRLLGCNHIQTVQSVQASRTVPSESDLAFLLGRSEYLFRAAPLRAFGFGELGDKTYLPLAASMLLNLKVERAFSEVDFPTEATPELAENVNRMLTDHLFIERGYRLDVDYRVLLSPFEFGEATGSGIDLSTYPDGFPVLVRVFLVDSAGRGFSFSEVGSGLGYVLPVLCVAFGRSALPVIQQPELHLHPALQANLGDVFIEAMASGKKQIVVETHSEHVLLRVLKRIRETAKNGPISDGLRVEPDDVAIVYFEPSPDGVTKARHIRIGVDGEFLDRWPRGFFTERDQELFDE